VIADLRKSGGPGNVAKTLNDARDPIGNGVLHLAALNGCYEVLDLLLDQEGLEIDELDRIEKDTPLHKAVRYSNGLTKEEWEHGHSIVDILCDAGCDPRYVIWLFVFCEGYAPIYGCAACYRLEPFSY